MIFIEAVSLQKSIKYGGLVKLAEVEKPLGLDILPVKWPRSSTSVKET